MTAQRVPPALGRLAELARNLWWTWHPEARALFKWLDPALWRQTGHNPVRLLAEIARERLAQAAGDSGFRRRYAAVLAAFDAEMAGAGAWCAAQHPELGAQPIAYFSFEYGVHRSLPSYAGGLGILAGDHAKEASDLGLPLAAVGFMYPQGYFHQHVVARRVRRPDTELVTLTQPFEVTSLAVRRTPAVEDGRSVSSTRSRFKIVSRPDLRRLLTIASRHKFALAGGATGFFLATPLFVIASLWIRTGLLPNRLELLTPGLRSPSSGLSLLTVSAVGVIGGWEYEFTVRGALRLLVPAIMFGLYLSVLVATLRSWKTRRPLRMRRDVKSQAGAAGGLLALIGNALATGISLTPPCIGIVTTVSILGLLGFGAGVVILPYLYLFGSLIMLVSLLFLVRKVDPGDV